MNISSTIFVTILCLCLEVDSVIDGLKCPPLTIRKGRVRLRSRGRIAKYTCLRGFQLLGDRYSTCLRGRWDTPPPVCISDGCFSVSNDFLHGQTFESYRGGLVKFQCDPGYRLIGSPALFCNSISWNDTIPVCKEITTKAQRWCDFESEDLCGWTHDINHDFDWKRHNFATPSGHVGTGPAYDHTLGAYLDGHYMYLEASNPRLENDTARLFSPVFPAMSSNDSCFIFWYHMYGTNIGYLQVYRYDQKISLLFSQSGNHGNQWQKAIVPLPPIDTSFQIVIEGIRGTGYKGDTAIDDVKLTEGDECADEPVTVSVSILGTCEGRCHNKNVTTDTSACDCTDDCIHNSTCCSDFLALCGMVTISGGPSLTLPTASITLLNQSALNTLPTFNNTKSSESVIFVLPTTISTDNFTATNILHHGVTSSISHNKLPKQLFSTTPEISSTLNPPTSNTKKLSPFLSTVNTPFQPTFATSFPVLMQTVTTTANILSKPYTFSPWYKKITFNTTRSPPAKTTLSTLVIPNNTKSYNSVTKGPVIPASKTQFTLFTFFPKFIPTVTPKQFSKSSLIITPKRLPIFIGTPPTPIAFRTPKFSLNTKSVEKTSFKEITLAPNLLTTIRGKKTESPTKIPQTKTELNQTRNNILNPYWDKIRPSQISTLNPKLLIPSSSFPSPSDALTTPVITNIVKKKFKSKYKRKDMQAAQVRILDKKLTAGIAACLGMLTLLIVATVASICYVRKRRINRRNNMDGEADVLFFTADEILDFSLARPSSSEPSVCESQR